MEIEELRNNIIERLKTLNDIEPLSHLFDSMQGEFAVLSLVAEKERISPSEMSCLLGISKARCTVILKTLKKKGFVSVDKCKEDKRKQYVSLTSAGKESINNKVNKATSFFDDYLTELGEKDTKKLIVFLDKSIKIAKHKVIDD